MSGPPSVSTSHRSQPSEFSKRAKSDFSLDPSEAESNLDPKLIRAVGLDVCLANFGRHFQTGGPNGGLSTGHNAYDLSQQTDHIDDFLSHDWKTSRFHKVVAMFWTFNSRAALVASTVVSCMTGVIRIFADDMLGNHWWPVCFGYLAFAFTMCFWQRIRGCFCKGRKVFLDRLCISQEDEVLKRQGLGSWPRVFILCWSSLKLSTFADSCILLQHPALFCTFVC